MADLGKITMPSISPATGLQSPRAEKLDIGNGPSFKEALGGQMTNSSGASGQSVGATALNPLKFSNHAIERMRSRGIAFSPEQMNRIESAVGKATAKGAKETLLLTDDSAMIVNIPNRTVVTVMDKNSLKENVFTNIDSTVMV